MRDTRGGRQIRRRLAVVARLRHRLEPSGRVDDAGSAQERTIRWVHDGVRGKVIVVDRQAGLVRVEYEQGGRCIVETWRVKSAGETNTYF